MTVATQKMRQRLTEGVGRVSDVTIAASAYLWVATCFIDDEDRDSVSRHGRSILKLVDSRGGLADLGMCGAIARILRWSDILASLSSHRACWFEMDTGQAFPAEYECRGYGHSWLAIAVSAELRVNREVVELCQRATTCVALFDENNTRGLNAVTYVATRQRLTQMSVEISKLKAKYVGTNSLEECVLTTLNVCHIIICAGCEVPSPCTIMVRHRAYLAVMVKGIFDKGDWHRHLDTLIWIVFTMTLVRQNRKEKSWCDQVIEQVLTFRFGPRITWSPQWHEQLVALLCSFTWSAVRLTSHVNNVCQALWNEG